jgi:hypothetical protein
MSELKVEPAGTLGCMPQIGTIPSPGEFTQRATSPSASFVPVSGETIKLPIFDAKTQPSIRYSAASVASISDYRAPTPVTTKRSLPNSARYRFVCLQFRVCRQSAEAREGHKRESHRDITCRPVIGRLPRRGPGASFSFNLTDHRSGRHDRAGWERRMNDAKPGKDGRQEQAGHQRA